MGLETGDLENYGLFLARSTPLPSSEAASGSLYLTPTKTPSINRRLGGRKIRFSPQHRPTTRISTSLSCHLPGWDSRPANSSRYPSFRLIAGGLPRDSLASTSAGDQARKRVSTTRSRLRTRDFRLKLRISRRHHRLCGIPEAPTSPAPWRCRRESSRRRSASRRSRTFSNDPH